MNDFYPKFAKILNSGQTKSVVLSGNIYDLFYNEIDNYVPLVDLIKSKTKIPGIIRIVYELNGPIQILDDRNKLVEGWKKFRGGPGDKYSKEFEQNILDSIGNTTLALEFLRQLTLCSRQNLKENLLIVIEGGEVILPHGNYSQMQESQVRRIAIMHDWFSDPEFCNGRDAVCLIAESVVAMHPRIASMPQLLNVEVLSPDKEERERFIKWSSGFYLNNKPLKKDDGTEWVAKELAEFTAGLSLHALRQLLINAFWNNQILSYKILVSKIEEYIQSQVGEDVVEFKKPTHTLDDVVGYANLKGYLEKVFIPRIKSGSLSGAAIAGPLGSGKTFTFEAVAAVLEMPVLVLKNIRSQWYGQTDVIFERLRRVLMSLEKVAIFVDEADTQFGGLGQEEHSTERRLTGKIQAMMSDVALKGKVVWLLMTARIHRLSPDIRRPGRVGDLIIPILDPEPEDAKEFSKWILNSILDNYTEEEFNGFSELTQGFSAAQYSSLKAELKASKEMGWIKSMDDIYCVVFNTLPSDIEEVRKYQTYQALVNCTRRDLIPESYFEGIDSGDLEKIKQRRQEWMTEIKRMEALGIN